MKFRNYTNENKRQKEINHIFKVKVKKEVAEKLQEKLKKENTNFSKFVRERIEEFINE